MTQEKIQIALGLILASAIWLGLDHLLPHVSSSLTFALAQMSAVAIVAFGVGGLVAKSNFIVPATVLALVMWLAATAFSLSIGLRLGNPMWPQFVWNLPSLVLVPAVAIGAAIGTSAGKHVQELRRS
jgi:hypothetical protein